MLNWSKQFSIILLLDSNHYSDRYSKYEFLLAVNAIATIPATSLDALYEFHAHTRDWLFGHISYDYKNQLEANLTSAHADRIGFDDLFFFQPETVCYIKHASRELIIETFLEQPDDVYEQIMASSEIINEAIPTVNFRQRTSRQKYLNDIESLRRHIKEGDCYEINYCTENYAESISITPHAVYARLNSLSNAPFAAYYRNNDKYLMCASPERYIQKSGGQLTSQPIKGTARRGADTAEDQQIKNELLNSIKERAENVMITDLVRNDLARSCTTGSVNVNELFGIYTFPQVHQMISTISGTLQNGLPFTDAIRFSFPMGSMTGAPKIKVMQLVEAYEDARRGLFSGTVGYITPGGDFDFNVVIRSLFYNATTGYLAYLTGGAITYDSVAEAEWDEMRLKAWAMEKIFSPA